MTRNEMSQPLNMNKINSEIGETDQHHIAINEIDNSEVDSCSGEWHSPQLP